MRVVTKVVKRQKSRTAIAVTEKDFSVSNNNLRICKEITTLCVHTEKSGSVQKPLKCVWCGIDTYFICRVCLDSNKKPIIFYLNPMQEKSEGKK